MPKKFDNLPREEKNILKNANAGVAFDSIHIDDMESNSNISSQNKDTGLPSYNPDDTRPYEQKNTSAGFHKSGIASK